MNAEPSVGPLTPPTFPPVFLTSIFVGPLVGKLVVRVPLVTEVLGFAWGLAFEDFVGVWLVLGFVIEADFVEVMLCWVIGELAAGFTKGVDTFFVVVTTNGAGACVCAKTHSVKVAKHVDSINFIFTCLISNLNLTKVLRNCHLTSVRVSEFWREQFGHRTIQLQLHAVLSSNLCSG